VLNVCQHIEVFGHEKTQLLCVIARPAIDFKVVARDGIEPPPAFSGLALDKGKLKILSVDA
jgi:hypothetical protein